MQFMGRVQFNPNFRWLAATGSLALATALSQAAFAQTTNSQTRTGTSTSRATAPATQTGTSTSQTGTSTLPSSSIADSQTADVVVTGYRKSLEDSANAKKSATNFTDSIFAEDVGTFPDLNLAESLQRLPGVQIDRDRSGEGTTINVRGLSAGFTVTTINGFATTTTAYSGNEGRGSGLDVLPNELFRRLTLSKSPTANMVEGGTAGVVDLQPLSAFDRKGFHISVQGQTQYQDANGNFTPRGALIVSNTFKTGIGEFGILAAAAYAQRTYRSESFDTIGWTTLAIPQACPRPTAATGDNGCNSNSLLTFNGYGGGAGATLTRVPGNVPSELGLGAAGSVLNICTRGTPGGTSGLSCEDLSYALVPRLMRAEQTTGQRKRWGGLVSFGYRPASNLRFDVDLMVSDVKNSFQQYQNMLVVRSYNNQIPINFKIDEDRVLTQGTFGNTYFLNQTEAGNTPSDLFYRSAKMAWDVTPTFHFSMAGMMNTGHLLNQNLNLTLQSAPATVDYTFNPVGRTYTSVPGTNLTPTNTGQYAVYNYTPGDLTPSISSNIDLATYNKYYPAFPKWRVV